MADDADIACDHMERELPLAIAAARGDIPPGVEGECDLCGEESKRLIGGACAPCRDRFRIW
jgi:hypothetical protein